MWSILGKKEPTIIEKCRVQFRNRFQLYLMSKSPTKLIDRYVSFKKFVLHFDVTLALHKHFFEGVDELEPILFQAQKCRRRRKLETRTHDHVSTLVFLIKALV